VTWVQAAALCALLAVIHTWPLASAPGTLSRNDNGDTMLNEWTLAWVEHQLPRVPAHLFQGNIFYPAHDALAFSEPLIVPAILGGPVAWLGGSPVLVFNLMLMAGFALTTLSAYCLVVRWTGVVRRGCSPGTIFAFNFIRWPHCRICDRSPVWAPLALFRGGPSGRRRGGGMHCGWPAGAVLMHQAT
jgi:hypothetical protein